MPCKGAPLLGAGRAASAEGSGVRVEPTHKVATHHFKLLFLDPFYPVCTLVLTSAVTCFKSSLANVKKLERCNNAKMASSHHPPCKFFNIFGIRSFSNLTGGSIHLSFLSFNPPTQILHKKLPLAPLLSSRIQRILKNYPGAKPCKMANLVVKRVEIGVKRMPCYANIRRYISVCNTR
jgi:hypothetical protein